ncbi:hypothetical protein EV384_2050 [Micromonospora kangleipakensis]|uniref:Restriction endonuclease AspBHI N-terminal domain-containing protein n=1 Tax=Micromonospora kangleipakensis TaxID=1077942 RepID=A0A4Q8B9F4_9ACTN|nr:hypothetical protein [Micromonospora kangleipakensis]RZU73633.1 hypothetical protein EV384_2050 [Micromonospora kangleipakensis]
MKPRIVRTHDILRYARDASPHEETLDGYLNYYFVTSSPDGSLPRIQLERGINAPANVHGPDGVRRPVVALRSSPWKAGHATNPWYDEFDLNHGRVRYYGDHKATTPGSLGTTAGNKALIEAWPLFAATSIKDRLLAPPLLLFRSVTVERDGQALVKGHVEFCGVGIIQSLEQVVQQDGNTGGSFPNLALDIAVVDASDRGDAFDMRWIDDRRNPDLDSLQANRYAPLSWSRWVREGNHAFPQIQRSVIPPPRTGS